MQWERSEVSAQKPTSLLWLDSCLYDIGQGWLQVWSPTGPRKARWAPYGDFDTSVLAPKRDLVALVDSDGTKALIFDMGGRVVREIHRNYYCAWAFRYPLALFTLPDGRTGIEHCPRHYNQIEIEVAATGEKLTMRPDGAAADIFITSRRGH